MASYTCETCGFSRNLRSDGIIEACQFCEDEERSLVAECTTLDDYTLVNDLDELGQEST